MDVVAELAEVLHECTAQAWPMDDRPCRGCRDRAQRLLMPIVRAYVAEAAEDLVALQDEATAQSRHLFGLERPAEAIAYAYKANAYADAIAQLHALVAPDV